MGSFPRSPRSRSQWREFVTPAVRNIVLACTGVFLIEELLREFYVRGYALMIHLLGLMPLGSGFLLWQPVTYLFLHEGLLHILFNMLFLWMFGVDLERSWGSRRFYWYFFITGIGAGLINILVKVALAPLGMRVLPIPTIGASGAIYGILLASA